MIGRKPRRDGPQPAAAGEGGAPAIPPAVLLWGVLGVLILSFGAVVLWFLREQRQEPLPILSTVPDFVLVNRDGRTVTRDAFLGRPWIADFIFTRCVAVCPRMTWQLGRLKDSLPGEVRVASISVDPEHDTPEVLSEYAARHRAGDDWYFLTGEVGVVDALTREAFLLPLDRSPGRDRPPPEIRVGPDEIIHGNHFVLVDGEARIRGYYDAFDGQAIERLLRDVRTILAEG